MPPDPNVTPDPEDLRWHRYGAVEVAVQMDGREPRSILARHLPVTSPDARPLDERIFRHVTVTDTPTGGYWIVEATGQRSDDDAALSWLFDAAAALLWHALEVAPDAAGRLVAYNRETYLETYTEPDVGDTFEVVRGNGPREGDHIGTATVIRLADDGGPVLDVRLDRGGAFVLGDAQDAASDPDQPEED